MYQDHRLLHAPEGGGGGEREHCVRGVRPKERVSEGICTINILEQNKNSMVTMVTNVPGGAFSGMILR